MNIKIKRSLFRTSLLSLRYMMLFIMMTSGLYLFAQAGDCSRFKNGKFTIHDTELEDYLIVRDGNIQTETYKGHKGVFIVNWIDACTYTLKPTKETIKHNPDIPKKLVITVKIIQVKENSYIQTSTTNIYDISLTKEMFRVE